MEYQGKLIRIKLPNLVKNLPKGDYILYNGKLTIGETN